MQSKQPKLYLVKSAIFIITNDSEENPIRLPQHDFLHSKPTTQQIDKIKFQFYVVEIKAKSTFSKRKKKYF